MILIVTDLHWGMKKFSDKSYQLQMRYFKDVIFPYILYNKIKNVIHLGDIIDDPELIDNRLLQDIKHDFVDWFVTNDINFYSLVGNHDIYHRDNTNYNFNKVLSYNNKNFKDISDVQILNIDGITFGFVPHSKSFDELCGHPQLDFICGHHDIKDVVFNSYQKSKKGLSADELTEKFKNVPILLGHYHNQSITRGCRYMGTLFQHSWGEYGFRKGFWVIGDDKKINFIDSNDHFPKHIRIEYTQEGKKQPTYYISDGISDVICTTDYNLVKEFVSKNHIEFIAEKYDSETKYNQLILDLSNTSYGDFNVINNKRLSKAIAQLLDVTEEECGEDDIKNNSNIIELCQYFLNSLPESLENKKEIIKLFDEKISKL